MTKEHHDLCWELSRFMPCVRDAMETIDELHRELERLKASRDMERIAQSVGIKLLPCPWCGAHAKLWENGRGWTIKHADTCFGRMHGMSDTTTVSPKDAAAWNSTTPERRQA